ETCCTYDICVLSARFRTCMSSVIRWRRDVIETPLRDGMRCKQRLHALARECVWERLNIRELRSNTACWSYTSTAKRFSPIEDMPSPRICGVCWLLDGS